MSHSTGSISVHFLTHILLACCNNVPRALLGRLLLKEKEPQWRLEEEIKWGAVHNDVWFWWCLFLIFFISIYTRINVSAKKKSPNNNTLHKVLSLRKCSKNVILHVPFIQKTTAQNRNRKQWVFIASYSCYLPSVFPACPFKVPGFVSQALIGRCFSHPLQLCQWVHQELFEHLAFCSGGKLARTARSWHGGSCFKCPPLVNNFANGGMADVKFFWNLFKSFTRFVSGHNLLSEGIRKLFRPHHGAHLNISTVRATPN